MKCNRRAATFLSSTDWKTSSSRPCRPSSGARETEQCSIFRGPEDQFSGRGEETLHGVGLHGPPEVSDRAARHEPLILCFVRAVADEDRGNPAGRMMAFEFSQHWSRTL